MAIVVEKFEAPTSNRDKEKSVLSCIVISSKSVIIINLSYLQFFADSKGNMMYHRFLQKICLHDFSDSEVLSESRSLDFKFLDQCNSY